MPTDQISDLLTRIRNAQMVAHPTVAIPASKSKRRIIDVLLNEGYIAEVEEAEDANNKPVFKIYLRYTEKGDPVIKEMKRISRPGRRAFVKCEDIPFNKGGLGILVVSTSKGVLTDSAARKAGVGGELICSVF